jgi:hypothetical protein
MPAAEIARVRQDIDALYRKDSRRIFATLIRFVVAFSRKVREGVPDAETSSVLIDRLWRDSISHHLPRILLATFCMLLTAAATAGNAWVLQPVLGVYRHDWLPALREAPDGAPLTRTVEGLRPARLALPALVVRSVDTPEDLLEK